MALDNDQEKENLKQNMLNNAAGIALSGSREKAAPSLKEKVAKGINKRMQKRHDNESPDMKEAKERVADKGIEKKVKNQGAWFDYYTNNPNYKKALQRELDKMRREAMSKPPESKSAQDSKDKTPADPEGTQADQGQDPAARADISPAAPRPEPSSKNDEAERGAGANVEKEFSSAADMMQNLVSTQFRDQNGATEADDFYTFDTENVDPFVEGLRTNENLNDQDAAGHMLDYTCFRDMKPESRDDNIPGFKDLSERMGNLKDDFSADDADYQRDLANAAVDSLEKNGLLDFSKADNSDDARQSFKDDLEQNFSKKEIDTKDPVAVYQAAKFDSVNDISNGPSYNPSMKVTDEVMDSPEPEIFNDDTPGQDFANTANHYDKTFDNSLTNDADYTSPDPTNTDDGPGMFDDKKDDDKKDDEETWMEQAERHSSIKPKNPLDTKFTRH